MELIDLMTGQPISICQDLGGGLRAEIAHAIPVGRPALTSVSERSYPAWCEFTDGNGTALYCNETMVREWWSQISTKFHPLRRNPD